MDELGFVFDPLDLKVLILVILRRLPEEIETDRLFRLCQEDGVVNYFDFSVCLDDLRESGQVALDDGWCRITERGMRNADMLESSLPYSVRRLAEKTAEKEAAGGERSRGHRPRRQHPCPAYHCRRRLHGRTGAERRRQRHSAPVRPLCGRETGQEDRKTVSPPCGRDLSENHGNTLRIRKGVPL